MQSATTKSVTECTLRKFRRVQLGGGVVMMHLLLSQTSLRIAQCLLRGTKRMNRTIFMVWIMSLVTLVWISPEAVGEWQAKRDIAYEDTWEATVP